MHEPEPSAHHRKLAVLAGSWIGEETMHPSPWNPDPAKATGHIDSRMDIDGLFLISDYHQVRDEEVTFRGHGVYGYDPASERFTMYWFDSMSYQGGIALGTWVGDELVFERSSHRGTSRYVYEIVGPDEYRFRIEMSPDGEALTPWLECVWKRS
jgi:hypothetical protein